MGSPAPLADLSLNQIVNCSLNAYETGNWNVPSGYSNTPLCYYNSNSSAYLNQAQYTIQLIGVYLWSYYQNSYPSISAATFSRLFRDLGVDVIAQDKLLSADRLQYFTAAQLNQLAADSFDSFKSLMNWIYQNSGQQFYADSNHICGLSSSTISQLNNSALSSLLSFYSSANTITIGLLNIFSISQSQVIDFTKVSQADICQLNSTVISGLTAGQLEQMTLSQLHAITTYQMGYISNITITALGTYISNFTPAQLSGFTSTQVPAITPQQWASLNSNQQNIISSTYGAFLNPAVFSHLTADQIGAIPAFLFQYLTKDNVKALSASQVGMLLANQVWSMSSDTIGGLATNANMLSSKIVLGLSIDQYQSIAQGLSNGNLPLFKMNASQIASVSASDLAIIPIKSLAALSTTSLAQLNRVQCLGLTVSEFQALNSTQSSVLNITPLSSMSASQIALANLTKSDIISLPVETISALTPSQFLALSGDQRAAFTQSQIKAMSSLLLNSLSPYLSKYFSTAQLLQLSPGQLIGLYSGAASSLSGLTGVSWSQDQLIAIRSSSLTSSLPPTLSFNATILRNLYINADVAGRLTDFFQAFLTKPQYLPSSPNGPKAYQDLNGYFSNYALLIKANKNIDNGMKVIGSAIQLSAAASLFYQASIEPSGSVLTLDILKGLSYLASALKTPWKVMYQAYLAYAAATDAASMSAALKSIKNDLGLTGIETYFKAIKQGAGINAILALPPPPNSDYSFNSLNEINDSSKYSAADLKAVKLQFTNTEMNFKKGAGVALLSNIFGLTSSIATLATNSQVNSSNVGLQIANYVAASFNLASGLTATISDSLELYLVDAIEGSGAVASWAAKIAGPGFILSTLATDGLQVYSAYTNLTKDNNYANQVTFGLTIAQDTVQLALICAAVALGGPAGLVMGALTLVLPDPGSIGQALNLVDKWNQFDSQGRTVEGDIICYKLHEIAALNATPIINWTSYIYTPVIMNQLYSQMSDNNCANWILALQQDAMYMINGTDTGKKLVSNLSGYIKSANSNGLSLPISNIRLITEQSSSASAYFASKDNYYRSYWTNLNVLGDSSSSVQAGWADYSIIIADTKTSSQEVIILNNSDQTQVITVDARQSTESLTFEIMQSNYVIYGGSGINSYSVDTDTTGVGYVIWGSNSGADTLKLSGTKSAILNLDNLHNVVGIGNSVGNSVSGTQSSQIYRTGGGQDSISMTGGNGRALVFGRGTNLSMRGGGNYVSAVLGVNPNTAWAYGSYDGGAVKFKDAHTPLIITVPNNTLDFSASAQELSFNINEPNSKSPSSVVTADGSDGANFINFQNIVGSNLGDLFVISNTISLDTVQLGIGNNDVSISNSIGLTIMSGASINNIYISNSSNVNVASEVGAANIHLYSNSTIDATLAGSADTLDASDGTANSIIVHALGGNQTFTLNNEATIINCDAVAGSSDMINIIDANTRNSISHLLDIELNTTLANELVNFGVDGKSLSIITCNGSNQIVNYSVMGDISSAASTAYVNIHALDGPTTLSVAAIVQAMSSMGTPSTSYQGGNYFALTNVVNKIGTLAVIH